MSGRLGQLWGRYQMETRTSDASETLFYVVASGDGKYQLLDIERGQFVFIKKRTLDRVEKRPSWLADPFEWACQPYWKRVA